MNVHDSEKIAGTLNDMGYTETADTETADIIVFNTCCIRETAERKAIGNIGSLKKLKKRKPQVIIAVCGCMPQAGDNSQKLLEKFPFIDIIFGTHNIHRFKDYILKRITTGKNIAEIWPREVEQIDNVPILHSGKVNAFVNIIYGCNNFCTYCIVPYVRGRERSRPFEDVYGEVKGLIDSGYKEIMLLGQNVNSYGTDTGGLKFYQLLDRIARIKGKYRIRFMTSHPKDFDENLIKVIRDNEVICNNIHLPVQSGSDRVLKLMNRNYTVSDYLKIIDKIYKEIPDCGITSDVMVGFPQETEEDFKATLNLVKQVRYNGCYMFVYSVRKGTVAAAMTGQISDELKKERITRLIALQNSIIKEINKEKYLNKTFEVLVEGVIEDKKDVYCGKTDNGRLISFDCGYDCLGEFKNVTVTKSATSSLYGTLQDGAANTLLK
jgi:tRNA-2-methylthio-N6-dimethylallyladenosine synthase